MGVSYPSAPRGCFTRSVARPSPWPFDAADAGRSFGPERNLAGLSVSGFGFGPMPGDELVDARGGSVRRSFIDENHVRIWS